MSYSYQVQHTGSHNLGWRKKLARELNFKGFSRANFSEKEHSKNLSTSFEGKYSRKKRLNRKWMGQGYRQQYFLTSGSFTAP